MENLFDFIKNNQDDLQVWLSYPERSGDKFKEIHELLGDVEFRKICSKLSFTLIDTNSSFEYGSNNSYDRFSSFLLGLVLARTTKPIGLVLVAKSHMYYTYALFMGSQKDLYNQFLGILSEKAKSEKEFQSKINSLLQEINRKIKKEALKVIK